MNKHTPGPWIVATSNSWRRITTEDGTGVCEPVVYSERDRHPDLHFRNGGENGPDARLIAGSPTLLTAARAVLARWDSPNWKDTAPTADVMGELRKAVEACE